MSTLIQSVVNCCRKYCPKEVEPKNKDDIASSASAVSTSRVAEVALKPVENKDASAAVETATNSRAADLEQLRTITARLTNALTENEELRAQNIQANAELERLREENAKLRAEVEAHQSLGEASQQLAIGLTPRNAAVVAFAEAVEETAPEILAMLTDLQSELNSLKSDNESADWQLALNKLKEKEQSFASPRSDSSPGDSSPSALNDPSLSPSTSGELP